MHRRTSILTLLAASGLAMVCNEVRARDGRRARVGWINMNSGTTAGTFEAFRDGLHDRGWTAERNLTLELRSGERGDALRLHDELIQSRVEVIAASGALGLEVGLLARDVPVIFVIGGDPVEAGLVGSMARPDGNRTGMTLLAYELVGKRLELLTQVRPELQRVGFLYYAPHPGAREELRRAREAASVLGLQLRPLPLNGNADVEPALVTVERERLQAVLTTTDGLIARHAVHIADFAMARGVPVVSGWGAHVREGFLLSYGAGVHSFYHYLAGYVDKVLRGTRPADLPVELPPKVELVINRRTAKALGLSLPPALVTRADEFIDGPAKS